MRNCTGFRSARRGSIPRTAARSLLGGLEAGHAIQTRAGSIRFAARDEGADGFGVVLVGPFPGRPRTFRRFSDPRSIESARFRLSVRKHKSLAFSCDINGNIWSEFLTVFVFALACIQIH